MKKTRILFRIVIISLIIFFLYKDYYDGATFHKSTDFEKHVDSISFEAGEIIEFQIKDTYNDRTSVCQLRVPENYTATKPTPLFVYFSPGKGSYRVKHVPSFVDFKEYFVLALPYLNDHLPRIAIRDGFIDDLWFYDKELLEYVVSYIPNLSSNRKIAGGFSSGAHFIGSGLDQNWDGFTNFFNGFILHEGGGSPDMSYKGITPSHKILLTYGKNSNGFGEYVAELMTEDNKNVVVYPLEDTGHEINDLTVEFISSWTKYAFNKE